MTTTESHPFAALEGEEFIVLTTYRTSGEAVPTTVWFAEHNGALYITTSPATGKAKRVRANSQVTVAPSDMMGHVTGASIPAQAHEATEEERAAADTALAAKYGERLRQFRAQRPSDAPSTFLVVTPAAL